MKSLTTIILMLFILSGCSKRIVDKSRNIVDSTQSVKKEYSFLDTSKYKTYERMIFLPYNGGEFAGDSSGRHILNHRISKMSGDISDASTWPPELIVEYIKSLPDNVKLQYLPIYYERVSTGENGISEEGKSVIKTEVKKDQKTAKVETKSSIPWVFAMALVILGIFLIIWIVPRKTKVI
jgi:hypothetical protein